MGQKMVDRLLTNLVKLKLIAIDIRALLWNSDPVFNIFCQFNSKIGILWYLIRSWRHRFNGGNSS